MNSKTKFLIVGGSNTAITFAIYALMVATGVNYNLSLVLTYSLGIILGFVFNRMWTFAGSEIATDKPQTNAPLRSGKQQFLHYLLVCLLIFIINFLVLNMLVRLFELNPILSQAIAVALSTVCSYLLQKKWVFR